VACHTYTQTHHVTHTHTLDVRVYLSLYASFFIYQTIGMANEMILCVWVGGRMERHKERRISPFPFTKNMYIHSFTLPFSSYTYIHSNEVCRRERGSAAQIACCVSRGSRAQSGPHDGKKRGCCYAHGTCTCVICVCACVFYFIYVCPCRKKEIE